MKQKDIFTLAVRILGLVFLYHAFINLPMIGFSRILMSVAIYLAVAWWLLTTRWLVGLVFPNEQVEEKRTAELAAGIAKKTDG